MSNRLIEIGRIPLIPDPHVAVKASLVFSQNRAQTNQVMELGKSFVELPLALWKAIRSYKKILDSAMHMRDLCSMNDRALADIGIRRDQIPELYRQTKDNGVVDRMLDHPER